MHAPSAAALALALAGAALLAGSGACAGAAPPERIVLIVVDTLRRDHLSCYGGPVSTPQIDALAARGQRFTSAVASFHQTSMSMGALFTGRLPSIESLDPKRPLVWNGSTWCGMARFAGSPGEELCIPARLATLAERLRDAGFWTLGIASNELLYEPSGFSAGFDDWVEVGKLGGVPVSGRWRIVDGGRVTRAALEAVRRRPSDRFFLYVHYMDVHDHIFSDASYAETAAAVDAAVGALLGPLEAAGLLERASVILTADHGENLGEQHAVKGGADHIGNPSFAEVLDVPLIVAPPSAADPAGFLRTQDLYGLILGIAGLGGAEDSELAEGELFLGEVKYWTYQRGRWKSALRRESGRSHLFDLAADPGETHDLAEAEPQVVRDHLVRMSELSRGLRTADAARPLSAQDRARLRALGYLE